MSHDLEAAWASSELARKIISDPSICFSTIPTGINAYAGRDGNRIWPYADGVIDIEYSLGAGKHLIAVEYKRPNEGVHGVLTAIGQSHAYLKKGFSASVMILPETYPNLNNVGQYVSDIINSTSGRQNIGICTYITPNSSSAAPFKDKLTIHKGCIVDNVSSSPILASVSKIGTQWAHVREGSTDRDAFFKYLNAVKVVGGIDALKPVFNPPQKLIDAVDRISPASNPYQYLSYCTGTGIHDDAWRYFWYKNILDSDMMIGWKQNTTGKFLVNHVLSNIEKNDGNGKKQFFSGRSDSIKSKCVYEMNLGLISENKAWEKLAENFHNRAHSYREDIDSGIERIGYIEQSGRMSETGYRFLEACERSRDANSPGPVSFMARSLLVEGGFNTFLHYIHKLSDEKFKNDPMAFASLIANKYKFDQKKYLDWIETELADNLNVLKKVTKRGGLKRAPLQAELAVLRNFKIILPGFRVGVGIPINWPEVQKLQQLIT